MVTFRKGEIWLGVAAAAQVVALSAAHYFFTNRVYDALTRLGDELSRSGMSVDQSQAISHALISLKLSISDFVTTLGVTLITINLAAMKFLLDRTKQK